MTTALVFDADTVSSAAQRILTALDDAADALPGGTPLPARQILSAAGVAWDCEMAYVAFLTAQLGIPESLGETIPMTGVNTWPMGNLTVWTLTFEVGVIRKVTTGMQGPRGTVAPPTVNYLGDLTLLSSDVAVVINAAETLVARNLQPVPHDGNAAETEGGFHGVQFRFTVEAFPGPPLP